MQLETKTRRGMEHLKELRKRLREAKDKDLLKRHVQKLRKAWKPSRKAA